MKTLEKKVQAILRKNLKDNTLDYTVQMSISSLAPGEVKYAAQISSPAKGVQPITFVFKSYKELEDALAAAETGLDKLQVEKAYHQDRINTYSSLIASHQERVDKIDAGEADDIELEEV